MNLDEQLLREQSAQRSGNLREEQRNSGGGANDDALARAEQPSLRETVQIAKREEAAKEQKEGRAAAGAISAPIKQGTSKLLKQAWLNLIDSFGLTLIYIDVHVFLRQIFQKFFCKLGEEWLPNVPASPLAGGEAGLADSAAGKQASKSIGIVETMGFCLLNLGCLLLIIAIFTVFGMILKAVENPLETIAALLGTLWGALWGD